MVKGGRVQLGVDRRKGTSDPWDLICRLEGATEKEFAVVWHCDASLVKAVPVAMRSRVATTQDDSFLQTNIHGLTMVEPKERHVIVHPCAVSRYWTHPGCTRYARIRVNRV